MGSSEKEAWRGWSASSGHRVKLKLGPREIPTESPSPNRLRAEQVQGSHLSSRSERLGKRKEPPEGMESLTSPLPHPPQGSN
jgi:hypothetical protein